MKKKINLSLLILLGICNMVITGCADKGKGCTDPNATNYDKTAENDDGTCVLARTSLIGTFSCTEHCTNATTATTSLNIIASPNNTANVLMIFQGNNYQNGDTILATVSQANFTIGSQSHAHPAFSYTISGTGTLTGTSISMSISEDFSAGGIASSYTCTVTGTK